MQFAIFGIDNGGLNLVANLFVMGLVVVWLALIVWTYLDASRRIEDPVLVACATGASLFPYIGTFVYSILRPPEFLDDAHERKLEIKAAELRVRQLSELSCPNCRYPVEKSYLRCPNCQRRLKDPCEACGKPVDPRWALCPYCETALPGRQQRPQRREAKRGAPRGAPQRAPGRRTQAAQTPSQRSASPTAGKGRSSAADGGSKEAAERPRAGRRK
jgi:double zinc ribbon protein